MATERIIIAEVPLYHTGPVVLDIKAASAYLTACGVAASVAALRRWRKEWLRNGEKEGPGPRGYLVTEKQLRYRLDELDRFIREGDGYISQEETR